MHECSVKGKITPKLLAQRVAHSDQAWCGKGGICSSADQEHPTPWCAVAEPDTPAATAAECLPTTARMLLCPFTPRPGPSPIKCDRLLHYRCLTKKHAITPCLLHPRPQAPAPSLRL